MKEEKKITPLDFINRLEDFFQVKSEETMPIELAAIKKLLKKVDKNSPGKIKQGYSIIDPNYFREYPKNIHYYYKEN